MDISFFFQSSVFGESSSSFHGIPGVTDGTLPGLDSASEEEEPKPEETKTVGEEKVKVEDARVKVEEAKVKVEELLAPLSHVKQNEVKIETENIKREEETPESEATPAVAKDAVTSDPSIGGPASNLMKVVVAGKDIPPPLRSIIQSLIS